MKLLFELVWKLLDPITTVGGGMGGSSGDPIRSELVHAQCLAWDFQSEPPPSTTNSAKSSVLLEPNAIILPKASFGVSQRRFC